MEPVTFQTMFNLAVGALAGVMMLILNAVWVALKDLQKTDSELTEKVNEIETLIAGQYVKRDEFLAAMNLLSARFEKSFDLICAKLDSLLEKMSTKMDRVDCIQSHPRRNHNDD